MVSKAELEDVLVVGCRFQSRGGREGGPSEGRIIDATKIDCALPWCSTMDGLLYPALHLSCC